MKYRSLALAAALACAAAGAQAVVTASVSGDTLTLTENFNGGSSLSGGWFNAPFSSDDYLWLSALSPSASASAASGALASLDIGFWYSAPFTGGGTASLYLDGNLLQSVSLGSTGVSFLLNNPGASSGNIASNADAYVSFSLANLAAGTYTLSFQTNGGLLDGLKVDDLSVVAVSAVPEPGSVALLLAGLGVMGGVARRRIRR